MSDTARGSRVGSQFGHYNLTRLIGRGGMGEVYEAQDTVKQRVVALKLLSPVLSHDPAFRERLQREARTAGRLQDPHVVPIHDYGEIDGQLFLDMRLIDGTDLSAMLKELGPLPPTRAVGIVRQVALALDAAHTAGVIHRDVKPENILVTRDDFAYLVDFGIADAATLDGATQVGDAAASFKYSAPERFGDATQDHRVDVYSLACVLYECLTGWSPYRGDNARMLITSHLMRPIPRPSQLRLGIVPESFDDVIARGMAKEPQERYSSAGELARAAYQALSGSDQDLADDTSEHTQVVTPPSGFEQQQSHRPPPPPPPAPHVPSGPSYPGPEGGPEPTRSYEPGQVPNAPEPARPFEPGPGHGGGPEPTRPYEPAQVANAPEPTRPYEPGQVPNVPEQTRPFEPGPPPANGRAQQPAARGWPAVPPQAPTGHAWPGEFGTPLPGSLRRSRKPKLLALAAVAAVIVLAGGAFWLLRPSHDASEAAETADTTSTTAAPKPPDTAAQARLLSLLPAGYPPGSCKPTTLPKDALAKVSCGMNSDPDGPSSATFTLFPDTAALHFGFNGIVQNSAVVDCPGRIQSPGPWHRNATPDKTSGMLLCATQKAVPTVAWTNDAECFLGVAQAEPQGTGLEQVYTWWTSHS